MSYTGFEPELLSVTVAASTDHATGATTTTQVNM